MGRITTPPYRLEFTAVDRGAWTPGAWRSESNGRPTAANLAAYVRETERSTMAGGCNAHLGATRILAARIVRQSTGDVVATYDARPADTEPTPAERRAEQLVDDAATARAFGWHRDPQTYPSQRRND